MKHSKLSYFSDADVLHLSVSEMPEVESVEISPDVTAELDENGDLVGIEILNASNYLRDTVLETVQARLLQLKRQSA